ncbi:MAG: erythromycin esterase family protein [Candidatus Aquicultor sp.]
MMDALRTISYSLENENDLDPLIEQAGVAQAVLIGTATHGTSEFYKWRAAITRRLIIEKGFSFVAVEGDWPACYQVNRYVKGAAEPGQSAADVLRAFNRWPTWLWANTEVEEFVTWLKEHNENQPGEQRVGFYGLDVYSLWESLRAAVKYLKDTVPDAADAAKQIYRRFEPSRRDIEGHTWSVGLVPEPHKDEVVRFLSTLEHLPPVIAADAAEEKLSAEQNAMVAINAERYYRATLSGDPDAWNVREGHMANTFFRLMDFHERTTSAKGIIWAHNTHAGDAQATDMVAINQTSIGQIVRGALGAERTYLMGFGSYEGSLIAADDWDAPMKEMPLPPATFDSWEHLFHGFDGRNRMVLFTANRQESQFFSQMRDHRGIGVVYDPNAEFATYTPTALRDRYDAFLYIDRTSALKPLPIKPETGEPPGTYPSAA